MKTQWILLLILAFSGTSACRDSDPQPPDAPSQAQFLFRRFLNRNPFKEADLELLGKVQAELDKGDPRRAAQLLTDQDEFLMVTALGWARPLIQRDGSTLKSDTPYDGENLILSIVAQDLDGRKILTATDSDPTEIDAPQGRVRFHTPNKNIKDRAGVLTTSAWGKQHLDGGTYRRNIQYALDKFLCRPIESWMDTTLPDHWVGQDVDRAPGDDPAIFQERCIGCHAGMDALRGAFAHWTYDFYDGTRPRFEKVAGNLNRTPQVYPYGHYVRDDSWENYWIHSSPIKRGSGAQEFGQMLAQSEEFSQCMAKTVFQHMCRRSGPQQNDSAIISRLSSNFKKEGYRLKTLFEESALHPNCDGDVTLRNRLEQEQFLVAANTDETRNYSKHFRYQRNHGYYLPEANLADKGATSEISDGYLVESMGAANQACDKMSSTHRFKTYGGHSYYAIIDQTCDPETTECAESVARIFGDMAREAWGRPPTQQELSIISDFVLADIEDNRIGTTLIRACTLIFSSPMSLIQ